MCCPETTLLKTRKANLAISGVRTAGRTSNSTFDGIKFFSPLVSFGSWRLLRLSFAVTFHALVPGAGYDDLATHWKGFQVRRPNFVCAGDQDHLAELNICHERSAGKDIAKSSVNSLYGPQCPTALST